MESSDYGNSPVVIRNLHNPKDLPKHNIEKCEAIQIILYNTPRCWKISQHRLASQSEEHRVNMRNVILLCLIVIICSAGTGSKIVSGILYKVERV
jgi:hypothetical protein